MKKETERLTQESQRLIKILAGIHKKLNNDSFVSRAPQDIIEQTTAQKENLETQLKSIEENLKALK